MTTPTSEALEAGLRAVREMADDPIPANDTKKPNPGSDEAVAQGCSCPVLDNGRGKGAYGRSDQFWIAENCTLHGVKA